MFFFLQQVRKELFREKTRIILTIFALAWGTFAISTMLSVGEGLRITFAQAVANTGHNLLTVRSGRTSKTYHGMSTNIVINLTNNDVKRIAALPNVSRISPQYSWHDNIRYKDKTHPEQIFAVDSNYNKIHEIQILPSGRFLSALDIKQKKSVIVLGTETKKDFFPAEENPVGKTIYISGKSFLVVGVMQPKTQISGHREPSDAFVNWIPYTTYASMFIPKKIDAIDLTYIDQAKLPELKQNIQQVVAISSHVDPNDDNIVNFTDYLKRQDKITGFFLGMQIFLGIVGALTLMVAGVGIANVMFASVHHATREIGIKMAIGARTSQIIIQYIGEALMATMIGGAMGLLMSAGLVHLINKIPMRGRLFEVIGQPHPILSLNMILIVIIILGLTGVFSGLFPALKASHIDPAEALSYE